MTVIYQRGTYQLCHDGDTVFFRHHRAYGVWYRVPPRCRHLKRLAFRSLREVMA